MEVCSTLMKSLYGRFLSQIKIALQERPGNMSLWEMYAWMRHIAGDKERFQQVIDSMRPSPVSGFSWPMEETYGFFEEEAREQNKWQPLADLLWAERTYMLMAQRHHAIKKITGQRHPKLCDIHIETNIRDYVEPLLESLLKTSRVADAGSIVTSLSTLPHAASLIMRAVIVANNCNMPQLANQWSKIEIQAEKEIRDNSYLELLLDFPTSFRPTILLINGEIQKKQFDSLFGDAKKRGFDGLFETGVLLEWELNTVVLDSHMSKLMQERENWDGDETRWALLVHDEDKNRARLIYSSVGMPTHSDIAAALENGRVEKTTDILRRFIRNNPYHIEAKENLLFLLQKIAFEKTSAKISEMQDKDGNMELSPNDDFEIWNEYAALYRQLMYYYSRNEPSTVWERPPDTKLYQYSPTMKAVAREMLQSLSWAIQRQPDNDRYWNIWTSLSDPTSSKEIDDLMEVLTISPQSDPLNVPGLYAKIFIARRYRESNNWLAIEKLMERCWEMRKNTTTGIMDSAEISWRVLNSFEWEYEALPLLEAYLNLKKDGKIKEVLEIWKRSLGWETAWKPQAEKLFERYGRKGEFANR
jgi:hypothetical protein